MDKKEKELLSMQYQMEKTDIKQKRLEDRLMSISSDLKKSRSIRNFYFTFIIIFIVLLTLGGFYFANQNNRVSIDENRLDSSDDIKKLLVVNDSLQKELSRLKNNTSGYSLGKKHSDSGNIEMQNESNGFSEGQVGVLASSDTIPEDVKSKYKRQYCYINRVFQNNDVIFAEVDFIEFYKGKRAVKKAKEYGEAEYDIDKKGDTLYFLYNNYYIHNQNTKSVILELDDKARVDIDNINQISAGFPLTAFQKIITNKPVLILETGNGIVYKITQQKLP